MNIILIGYRGSGKSSIGKKLAAKLWFDFVDTDTLIVERAGNTIRDIFETEGEAGFRALESAVIAEVAAKDKQLIAAGGGAILNPANVAAFKSNGKIVWLKASPKVLFDRIQADPATSASRPNLATGGIAGTLQEIESILEKRTPLYQAAADVSFDVTYLTVDDAVRRLAEVI